MFSVSCPAVGNCTAVGDVYVAGWAGYSPLVESLANGTWTSTSVAITPSDNLASEFDEVTCPTTDWCAVYGYHEDSSGDYTYLAGTTNEDVGWLVSNVSGPHGEPGDDMQINDLACSSPGRCMAVGSYYDTTTGTVRAYAGWLTPAGDQWSFHDAPLPFDAGSDPQAFLNSVACTSTTCTAVGGYTAVNQSTLPLIETMPLGSTDPSQWSTIQGSFPAGASSGSVTKAFHDQVSCPADGNCTVVGDYLAGNYLPLVQTLGDG